MASITDIANACGVCKSTVSKALNGAPDIGAATREKVIKAAEELGYRPNSVARALKTNRTNTIGILYEDAGDTSFGLTHEYFASILEGFRKQAEESKYEITFINSHSNDMSYYENCRYRNFDGVALICTDFTDPEVTELVNSNIPVVSIDYVFNGRMAVMSDNLGGMEAVMNYVYEMGHRRIAYIHGSEGEVTKARMVGFYRAVQNKSLKIPEEYIIGAYYHDPETSAEMTEQLLALKKRPTCILYPDDFSAVGGINVIRQKGLRIPEDISVVGYDGIILSKVMEPVLTTLHQQTDKVGRIAARELINLIQNPKTTLSQIISVPGELWEGKSVKKL